MKFPLITTILASSRVLSTEAFAPFFRATSELSSSSVLLSSNGNSNSNSDGNSSPTPQLVPENGLPLPEIPSSISEPVFPAYVTVVADATAVAQHIRALVQQAALEAIAERGQFCLAIPGGSILKMLSTNSNTDYLAGDWTAQTTVVYVNHKCVAMDDLELATHAKARNLFLDQWKGATTLVLTGTDNAPLEAAAYEQQLKELSPDILPRSIPLELPVFDLALIGVGDDGHIGSLYPGRDAELSVGPHGPWVLPVDIKSPPSITLSGPVMTSARQVVVAACGVSDKYPQGKSAAMRKAVAEPNVPIPEFPAVGLRLTAKWIMDEAAASDLGSQYQN